MNQDNATSQDQEGDKRLILLYIEYEDQLRSEAEEYDRINENQLRRIHEERSRSIFQRCQRSNPFHSLDPKHSSYTTKVNNVLHEVFDKIKAEVISDSQRCENTRRQALDIGIEAVESSFYFCNDEHESALQMVNEIPIEYDNRQSELTESQTQNLEIHLDTLLQEHMGDDEINTISDEDLTSLPTKANDGT